MATDSPHGSPGTLRVPRTGIGQMSVHDTLRLQAKSDRLRGQTEVVMRSRTSSHVFGGQSKRDNLTESERESRQASLYSVTTDPLISIDIARLGDQTATLQ